MTTHSESSVFHPAVQPTLYQRVLCMTDDAEGDPIWTLATYNGEKYGYLGNGGHRIRPVFAWSALPPLVRPQQPPKAKA
ncbi:MAG: hypothetical protein V4451_16205 [Pseudomonadota bacterium]